VTLLHPNPPLEEEEGIVIPPLLKGGVRGESLWIINFIS